MGTFFKELKDRFAAMFDEDEQGAESSEVILVLVLLVVGLIGAWGFLKRKLDNKARTVGNCIDGAATTTTC